jgi:hypothetical protein
VGPSAGTSLLNKAISSLRPSLVHPPSQSLSDFHHPSGSSRQAGGAFHGRQAEYALRRLAYYRCGRCRQPYYGGLRSCEEAQAPAPARLEWPGPDPPAAPAADGAAAGEGPDRAEMVRCLLAHFSSRQYQFAAPAYQCAPVMEHMGAHMRPCIHCVPPARLHTYPRATATPDRHNHERDDLEQARTPSQAPP